MTIDLPKSIEAEEALVGSVLIDGTIYPLVDIGASDFFIHRHRFIWQAFTTLNQRGKAIDILTVTDELEKSKCLVEVGGAAGLTKLVVATVDAYNYAAYASIVKDKATRRNQIQIANSMVNEALNGGVDVAEVIDLLTESGDNDRMGRLVAEGVSELYDDVGERSKDPKDIWGIPTGFIDVDKRTGGMQRQQSMMISGTSGVGKTTIMLQIALNAAKVGWSVAIFEAEMDEQSCLRRLVEIFTEGEVTNRMMVTGRIPDKAWKLFTDAVETIHSLPLYINDNPAPNTAMIRTEGARMKAKSGLDLVCMDYVNLLTDKVGDGGNRNENITVRAKRFRQVCRYLNVAGLTIQSMTKEGMRAAVPQMADMSGPAEVIFGADVIFFLKQDEAKESLYRMLPSKQRYGDKGNAPIKLIRKGLAFYNCESHDPNPTYRAHMDEVVP